MKNKSSPPLIICEGILEMTIASQICKDSEIDKNIFKLDANGNSKYLTIATKICGQIDVCENPYSSVIVLFDREKNEDSFERIVQCVEQELLKLGVDIEHLIIGVADRTVESWILPFVDSNGNYPIEPTCSKDGEFCITQIRKRFTEGGKNYKKTEDGVKIISELDPVKLSKISPSFEFFFNQTTKLCDWQINSKSGC